MKEPADQPHAVIGAAVEGQHWTTRAFLRAGCRGCAGQAIFKVTQQEYRVAFIQLHGRRFAVDMQPALALHNQVETCAGQAVGAGVPVTAVAADMKQAGVEFEAV